MVRLLLVDASSRDREALARHLDEAGLRPHRVAGFGAALDALDREPCDVVLADERIPDMPGGEFLEVMGERHPTVPVILMNENATVPAAVLAMRRGAVDYLQRPLDPGLLLAALEEALGPRMLAGRVPASEPPEDESDPVPGLVGTSFNIRNVKELIRAAARSTSPVFVLGPSGTGKELVAENIHRLSERAGGPFVPVNCGALPEGLVESELFGAEAGAFTGATTSRKGLIRTADGGTLFLDEIGEMPMAAQVKLLRVLQNRTVRAIGGVREVPVDVRVVAASNRPPMEAIRAGLLREDLFYRIAVLKITLEPLHRRLEDLAPLCRCILGRLAERYGEGPREVAQRAMAAFKRHTWPGNVRELENVLDYVVAMGRSEARVELEHLPEDFGELVDGEREGEGPGRVTLGEPAQDGPVTTIRAAERELIRRAMVQTGGNKARAARLLGISRPYLYRRLSEIAGEGTAEPPVPEG